MAKVGVTASVPPEVREHIARMAAEAGITVSRMASLILESVAEDDWRAHEQPAKD